MRFKEQLLQSLPYLRRYARALSGSQKSGDAYVRALLEAAVSDETLREELQKGRVELYRAFTTIWSNSHIEPENGSKAGTTFESGARSTLASIPSEHRQALLLTTLEEFSDDDAARILGIETRQLEELVDKAIDEIDREGASRVLIIEDEPLIAMQLERLVTDLGHEVVATAATRREAVQAFERTSPSLVLADIQLADQSSGIDAVADILKIATVPIIFITAYPERLLTGEKIEPAFLVTKPFHEETVRVTISQALFFNSPEPVA